MFALLKYQHNISSWCWLRLNYFSRTKPKTQTQQPFRVNIWQLSANTTTGHAQADTRTWAHLSRARKVVTCCKFRKFSGRLRWQKLICSMAERSHKQRADDSCENRDRSAHSASAGLQRSRGIILQPVWDLQSHSSLGEAWGGNASRKGFRNTKEEKLDVWFLLSNMREEVVEVVEVAAVQQQEMTVSSALLYLPAHICDIHTTASRLLKVSFGVGVSLLPVWHSQHLLPVLCQKIHRLDYSLSETFWLSAYWQLEQTMNGCVRKRWFLWWIYEAVRMYT